VSGGEQRHADWLAALRAYLVLSLGLNLLWEAVQLPLYTIWTTGTLGTKAFAVIHCAFGDAIIAALVLVVALSLIGSDHWPQRRFREVLVLTVLVGLAYTIYSEWSNTSVRQSWTYSSLMPVLPLIGTGLSPLFQWLVVPSAALFLATRRRHK
jgi:hypothetical protein